MFRAVTILSTEALGLDEIEFGGDDGHRRPVRDALLPLQALRLAL